MKRAILWQRHSPSRQGSPRQRPSRARQLAFAALLTAVLAPVAVASNAQGPADRLKPNQLPELAESGKFHKLQDWLKQEYAGVDDPSIGGLIDALDRYTSHRQMHTDQRRAAYEEALAEARVAYDEQRTEDALVSAIEAHGLADDPDAMLDDEVVRDLVRRSEREADEARDAHRWVDALSLYRLLEMLHEDQNEYREQIEEANQHVRVLRIYAPRTLRDLQQARAERREAEAEGAPNGEQPIDLPAIDLEPWEEQIDDVGVGMLRQMIQQASSQHITSEGYAPLLSGAVDALLVFLRTEALEGTFPALRRHDERDRFIAHLEDLSADFGGAQGEARDRRRGRDNGELDFFGAATIIDRIMAMNERTVELPERVLIHEMAEGATGALDDFSSVIWPQQVPSLNRSIQGNFFGVGIQLSRRDGRLVVISPLLNTPAHDAGIKAGDIIAEVDGQDASTWSLDKAVGEITGPEGTKVTLGIERRGEPELIEYQITRARIEIESIRGWQHTDTGEWDYLIDSEDRIGYVRLTQFIRETANHLDEAIEDMQKTGPIDGLILDLRHNPGGLLASATDVADRFVEEGPLVFTINADGQHVDERLAQRHRTYQPFPVVVLINESSASGSEIVAGALQDHGRAVIVGTRSFGKGSVQDVDPLPGGAFLKLTKQQYKLPQGRIIDRQPHDDTWGIDPDLAIEMTDRQIADAIEFRQDVDVLREGEDDDERPRAQQILDDGLDPQLEAALLVLKTRRAARQIAQLEMPGHPEPRRAAHRPE